MCQHPAEAKKAHIWHACRWHMLTCQIWAPLIQFNKTSIDPLFWFAKTISVCLSTVIKAFFFSKSHSSLFLSSSCENSWYRKLGVMFKEFNWWRWASRRTILFQTNWFNTTVFQVNSHIPPQKKSPEKSSIQKCLLSKNGILVIVPRQTNQSSVKLLSDPDLGDLFSHLWTGNPQKSCVFVLASVSIKLTVTIHPPWN